MDASRLLDLLIAIPAFVAALTIHEFAHAWAGTRLGDDLAKRMGRLTLDPLKHLDPIGSLFFVLGALGGFFFGWAKPVPFNPRNFDNPRRDSMLVALAGPASNLLQLPIWLALTWGVSRLLSVDDRLTAFSAMVGQTTESSPMAPGPLLLQMLAWGVIINLTLAAFNMIPVPPLDGHYVLELLGPESVSRFFEQIRPYSFIILIVLINLPAPFNVMDAVLRPVQLFGYQLVAWTFLGQWMSFGA
jgi:Zn-dependent protease